MDNKIEDFAPDMQSLVLRLELDFNPVLGTKPQYQGLRTYRKTVHFLSSDYQPDH
jgi:hypothetical protein